MMGQNSSNSLQKLILTLSYTSIFLLFIGVIYKGPYQYYKRHDTTFVTTTTDTLPRSYKTPTLTFCKVVPYSQRFINLSQNATYKDIFLRYVKDKTYWHPSFIKKILVITDPIYMHYVEAKFEPDYFRPVLADYTRFGICFSADILDAVIRMGDGVPATHVLNIVFLMENSGSQEKTPEGVFSIQISDYHEELGLTGSVATLEETGTMTTMAKPGEGVIYKALPELHNYKTNCDTQNIRLSKCVENYLNNRFGGGCRMPWGQQIAKNELAVCSNETIYEKVTHLERLKMDGLSVMANITGCKLPCNRLVFSSIEIVRQTPYLVFPELVKTGLVNNKMAALMISLPWKSSMKYVSEVETYPLSSCGGEVGGYLGLFLGLSFWSIFENLFVRCIKAYQWAINLNQLG